MPSGGRDPRRKCGPNLVSIVSRAKRGNLRTESASGAVAFRSAKVDKVSRSAGEFPVFLRVLCV